MAETTLKRPKPGENEEELFRMQDEFLRSKIEPSAKVVNLQQTRQQGERVTTSQTGGEMVNPVLSQETVIRDKVFDRSFDAVQDIQVMPNNILLRNIVEKKYDAKFEGRSTAELASKETGFPKVFVVDNKGTDKTRSLFWQRVVKSKLAAKSTAEQSSNDLSCDNGSVMVNGPWASEIHKANLQKLEEMSREEILQEKQKLEKALSPDLIEFLRNRRKEREKANGNTAEVRPNIAEMTSRKHEHCKEKQNKVDPVAMEYQAEEILRCRDENAQEENDYQMSELPKPPIDMLKQAQESGWVHMDTVEPEKLKWMQDVSAGISTDTSPEEPYNARFDFTGLLLPYRDENLTVEKGLHHHGAEPERPGYTLQELLQLSRSSTQQQRCTALTTLANIMEKSRRGWYDKALHPAPLMALNEKNILLLLRFSLDDTSVAVVTAALQALRAFLYSEADEMCLDRLLGWSDYYEPSLTPPPPPPTDVNDINHLKDHELAQLDTVLTALRSDIVLRIRYILSSMQPPPIGVTAALEILIRLARYSPQTAFNIACTPNLLDTIVKHFMPLTTNRLLMEDTVSNAYGVPMVAAVRLCRILICYAGEQVAHRLYSLQIVHSIASYISSEAGKQGIHLHIESLRLWKLLLIHGLALESVRGAQLILISQLRLLMSNLDLGRSSELSYEYAGTLISVASCEPSLKAYISPLLCKWSTQLAVMSSPTWGSTKLISQALMAVNDISLMRTSWINNRSVFSNLCSTSNLLSNRVPVAERDPQSLPNLGVLTENGQLQPVVSQHCCIPFLGAILNAFTKSLCKTEIQKIFNVPEFVKYIDRLESTEWSLERSWFTRIELTTVTTIVRAGSLLGNSLSDATRDIVWKMSIKLISTLPADAPLNVREMLKTALSNDRLKIEGLLNDLSQLQLRVSDKNVELELPQDLASLYEGYIMYSRAWTDAAMPRDWLYLPLVNLYANCKNSYKCVDEDGRRVAILLSLELALPELVQKLSPGLRFSRLSLVYLCDTIFLDPNVSNLLAEAVTRLVTRHYAKLDFEEDIPGLTSFTDLFTALCEHFCAASYGDVNFARALLVPIAQKHDAHYRKLLWSEHAGAFRSLGLRSSDLIVPLNEYLFPVEKDPSLIECYMSALVRGNVKKDLCPVPYAIALHHSAMYLKGTGKLATTMRARVERLENMNLKNLLLHYSGPEN